MFELLLTSSAVAPPDGWDKLPSGNIPLNYSLAAVATVGDEIYYIGGFTAVNLNLFVKFNTVTKVWTSLPNLTTAIRQARAVAVGTRIYVTSGYGTAYDTTFRCYDTVTGQWVALAGNANNTVQVPSIAAIGNSVYVFGGLSSNRLQRYDIATNTWTGLTASPVNMYSSGGTGTLTSVGGRLYAIGGLIATGNSNKDVYEYNPTTNAWVKKAVYMGSNRDQISLSVIQGKIYCQTPGLKYTDVYIPATDTWVYNKTPLRVFMNMATAVNDKLWMAGSADANTLFVSVDPFVV